VDDVAAAVNKVDDAFGQTGLLQQFEGAAHRKRNALRRLQDEGVAAGDGIGQEPVDDHRGKIEGRDGGDDSQRLANLHFVDAGGDVFEVVALHHHGDTAGNFNILNAAPHLRLGLC